MSDVLDLDGVGTAPVPEDAPSGGSRSPSAGPPCSRAGPWTRCFAFNVARGRRRHRRRPPRCSRCRRRTSSSRRPTATSATRRRAASRSAPTSPAARSRRTARGRGRAGTAATTGRASSTRTQMPRGARPGRGVHRRGEPGGHPGRRRPVPHRRLGLRLPRAAHPRRCSTRRSPRAARSTSRTWAASRSTQHSPYADVLVPTLLGLDVDDAFDDDGQELLRDVGPGRSRPTPPRRRTSRPSGRTLLKLTFGDDLPDGLRPDGRLALARGGPPPARRARRPRGGTTARPSASSRAATRSSPARWSRRAGELTAQLGKDADGLAVGPAAHRGARSTPCSAATSLPGVVRRLVNPRPDRGRAAGPRSSTPPRGTPAPGSFARHRGAVDADGRRPRRPRRLDVGDADGHVRAPGERALRRPVRRRGRAGETFPWPFTQAADGGGRCGDRLTLTAG